MSLRLPLLFFCLSLGSGLLAQTDSSSSFVDTNRIEYYQKTAYRYINGKAQKQYTHKNWLDTTGLVTRQERSHYEQTDTGYAVSRYYHYHYQPTSRLGEHYTELFPTPQSPSRAYSKQVTQFKNYDNQSDKRIWVKTQKPNSRQMLRQVQYQYDDNGYLTQKTTTDYSQSPSSSSVEQVKRNAAGNMVVWTSSDDDGDGKVQARDFTATYLDDTLLLRSDERLFYSATRVTNQYDGQNQLKKSVQQVGNIVKGKPKWTTQTTTWYQEGRPYKSQEKHLNKTTRKIAYTYASNTTTLLVTSKEGNYTDTQAWIYHDSLPALPTRYTETQKGQPFLEKTWIYTADGQLLQYTELEHRNNDKDWKKIEYYNDRGQLYWQQFYVGDQLNTEERYQYRYYPPTTTP